MCTCYLLPVTFIFSSIPSSSRKRPLLVHGPVVVSALGREDAGGTTRLAGAVADELQGQARDALHEALRLFRQPDPAFVAVVEEDGGLARAGVPGCGETADVPTVAHDLEGQDGDHGVLEGVQGASEVEAPVVDGPPELVGVS